MSSWQANSSLSYQEDIFASFASFASLVTGFLGEYHGKCQTVEVNSRQASIEKSANTHDYAAKEREPVSCSKL
jgi:hypothetical protein